MATILVTDATALRAQQEQQLVDARGSYHRLMTGAQTLEARHADGRMVRWDHTNLTALRAYINGLETALGLPLTSWTGFARTPARRILF
ncbi:gpW family protein [Methylobacterium organophilum]|uniref:gpW family protein n=1 Tax=Methylobacterium organophilum TaxID=410 RepID=UPI001F131315|nr:gpW family protein [Methylobacterium organophilum]UMY19124.1 gpW family protein [Methylobacterium organophilum]